MYCSWCEQGLYSVTCCYFIAIVWIEFWVYFDVCMPCLFSCIVWIQNRGFKTMRSKTRRLQSGPEAPVEAENYTPVFMKVSELHDTDKIFVF